MLHDLAHERVRDALAARLRSHIEDVERAGALACLLRDCEANLVDEQHDVLRDHPLELMETPLRVVIAPVRLGDIQLEGAPELAHEREVIGGCGANH